MQRRMLMSLVNPLQTMITTPDARNARSNKPKKYKSVN